MTLREFYSLLATPRGYFQCLLLFAVVFGLWPMLVLYHFTHPGE